MKNLYFAIIMVFCLFLVGCGKETPTSATTAPVTTKNVTSTPSPTISPTPVTETATPVEEHRPTHNEVDIPADFVTYVDAMEKVRIEPFLFGYRIVERTIAPVGDNVFGYEVYKVTYRCQKGQSQMKLALQATLVSYSVTEKIDDVCYDLVEIDGISYGCPVGLTGTLKNR